MEDPFSNTNRKGYSRSFLRTLLLKRICSAKGWRLEQAKGKGVKVEYWYPFDREKKKSLIWDEFKAAGGVFGERYFLRAQYAVVFNGSHIAGIPELSLPEVFNSNYAYASTALHELAHSTGAVHRLNRDLSGRFGSKDYAFEELIAEISSCFMSANLQMEQSSSHIENHKAYVSNWIAFIREKPESLIRAIQQAEKAASYMEYQAGRGR